MKHLITTAIFLLPLILYSQEYLYVGTTKYKSTNSWECTIEGGYPEFGKATSSVAKKSNGVNFKLFIDTYDN